MNLTSLLAVILALVAFFFVGSTILRITKIKNINEKFYDLFVRLIIGFCAVTTVFALIKTSGNTILNGFIIIGVFALIYIYNDKKKDENFLKFKFFYKQLIIPILIALGLGISFFFFQGAFFYNEPLNNCPHNDYIFYSKLAYFIDKFGVEGCGYILNPFAENANPTPYHYVELWFAIIISKIFQINIVECIIVPCYAILMVIISLGLIAIVRKFTINIFIQIIAVLTIFIFGFFPSHFALFYSNKINYISSTYSLTYTYKYIPISIFIAWFSILCINKHKLYFLPLLLLPIINIALAPAIFSGFFLSVLCKYLINKDFKTIKQLILPFVSTAIFIAGFYFLQAKSETTGDLELKSLIAYHIQNPSSGIINIVRATYQIVLNYAVYYLPILLILIIPERKKFIKLLKEHKNYFLICFSISLTGLLLYSLTIYYYDAFQFYTTFTFLAIAIIILVLISFAFISIKNRKTIKYLFLCYYIILFLVNLTFTNITFSYIVYSKDTHSADNFSIIIKENFEKRKGINLSGAYLKSEEESMKDIRLYLFTIKKLPLLIDGTNMVSLNLLDINSENYKKVPQNFCFSTYCHKKLEKGNFSTDSLQYLYVKEHNINYLYLSSKAELPTIFNEIVDTIITDNISKEKIVFLNKKQ